MSLIRHTFRAPAALGRTCTRRLSSSKPAGNGKFTLPSLAW